MLDISLTSCKIHGMAGRRPPTLSAKESLILERWPGRTVSLDRYLLLF